MYKFFSALPARIEAKNILHIAIGSELTPTVKGIIARYKVEASNLLQLGLTHMTAPRLRSYQTYIVHDTKTPLRFWSWIQKMELAEFLQHAALDKQKMYIGVGYGACLLQRQATLIKDDPTGYVANSDTSTPHLGILNHRIITHYNHDTVSKPFRRHLLELSMKEPVWCFTDGSSYDSATNQHTGKVYVYSRGTVKETV